MRVLIAGMLVFAFVATAVTWKGGFVLERLALAFDRPQLAAGLSDDPGWRGIALYRMGRFEDAAASFREAGKSAFFNRANALAKQGLYLEAVAFYDAVLFYNPNNHDARTNRALVDALIDKAGAVPSNGKFIREDATTRDGPAASKDDRKPTDYLYIWADNIRYKSIFRSEQVVSASEEWLQSLIDDPGRYLKLRVAAEHERRRRAGTAMASGGDPW